MTGRPASSSSADGSAAPTAIVRRCAMVSLAIVLGCFAYLHSWEIRNWSSNQIAMVKSELRALSHR